MKLNFSAIARLFLLSSSIVVGIILSLSPVVSAIGPKDVKELWQFPTNTWVENLAVRSNGKILVTILSTPEVWQVDPLRAEEPFLVARFPNVLGALGITELEEDVFVVAVANWSTSALQLVNANSCSLWTVDVTNFDPHTATGNHGAKTKKITDLPDALFLNGMLTLDAERSLILVADSGNGWIYQVNAVTGDYKVVLDDIALKGTDILPLGVNGIRLRDGILYFSNSAQGQFGRVKINPTDGTAEGPIFLLGGNGFADDFDMDPDPAGVAYATTDPFNDLKTIGMDGGVNSILGNAYSTLLAGDTSARFDRTTKDGRKILYVTTNGGLVRPVHGKVEGGKVLAVDLSRIGQ